MSLKHIKIMRENMPRNSHILLFILNIKNIWLLILGKHSFPFRIPNLRAPKSLEVLAIQLKLATKIKIRWVLKPNLFT